MKKKHPLYLQRIRHWKIFAQDLKALIEQTLSPPVIGIGHSLGAVTTYIAAAIYPQLEAQIFESIPLDVWKYAKRITCPVLAIGGEQTNIFFGDAAKRLNNIITDFELITVPNAGHFIPMEKPEPCARHIADFVKRKIAMAS